MVVVQPVVCTLESTENHTQEYMWKRGGLYTSSYFHVFTLPYISIYQINHEEFGSKMFVTINFTMYDDEMIAPYSDCIASSRANSNMGRCQTIW